ncbi:Protein STRICTOSIDINE SYNTHASE-LIKE 10 [Capsicum chinense]|nr:Protein STRICTOSIDINE SYNTHASE-LIKE 10 [Capsicum chinense]
MFIPLRIGEYDKSTKVVTVLLRGLSFANGVALNKDKSIVLVAENSTGRIVRYCLKGPRAGKHYTFINLTGYPDNIERNLKEEFWVALHSKILLLSKLVTFNSWLGKTVLKHPISIQQQHFIEDGQVLDILEDVESKTLQFISKVEEKKDKLWIGSVMVPFVGVYGLS